MNITVYCGANPGNDPAFALAARELGAWIGRSGHTLVWGGGGTGLMGAVATAALEEGGSAIGVIPDFLMELETPPAGFTNYQVTATMAQRRTRMIELADAFVALPGGPGTLEEISEIVSLLKLERLEKPLVLLNINGYFGSLVATYRTMVEQGFMPAALMERLQLADSAEQVIRMLSAKPSA